MVDSTMIGSGSVCFVGPPIKKTAVQPMLTCRPYPCAVPMCSETADREAQSPEQRDAHADDAAALVLFDIIQVARERQVVAVRVQRIVVYNARLPSHSACDMPCIASRMQRAILHNDRVALQNAPSTRVHVLVRELSH